LGGHHSHLYQRVLDSTGIEPPLERIPKLDEIQEENGFRDHARRCMEIYNHLRIEAEQNGFKVIN
jgi:hypothetical protein